MITPFCYDYQYKTESLYDSQFLGGTGGAIASGTHPAQKEQHPGFQRGPPP